MTIEVKVPTLPESVADATISTWHKQPGDAVSRDENLVDIETDKVVLEVPATEDGVLEEIIHAEGDTVTADTVIAKIKPGAAPAAKAESAPAEAAAPAAANEAALSPAVRKALAEKGLSASDITGTGKNGRILKEDVENHKAAAPAKAAASNSAPTAPAGARTEQRVPMTRLRKTIANRLLDAQHNSAMLTTFNELNMKPMMDLRGKYKDAFTDKHGIKLGFMSFFVKAATEALKQFPEVNASIDGDDIVYHGFCDVGIAVSSPRGLVVPILRNAEGMSMAGIEQGIFDYGMKAKNGQLTMDDMTGGTFTISNGGVFGSMLSTPIINPPQSAILGMHNTVQRPVVENGEIVIRPMMYLALSYDHRIIDGKEAVGFLVTIKNLLEDPARMLLDI